MKTNVVELQAAYRMLESLGVGVLLIDAVKHTILYANQAALRMSGYAAAEIEGAFCHKLVCPAEVGQCPISDLRQAVDNSERKLVLAGGGTLPIIKTVIPLQINGVACLMESFVDNQERKRLEEELIEKNVELSAMIEVLQQTQRQLIHQEKLAAIGQLAAGVAHEINNPMGFIISNMATLAQYMKKIDAFIKMQTEGLEQRIEQDEDATANKRLLTLLEEGKRSADIDYLLKDSEELIADVLAGAERVKHIVNDLKGFARNTDDMRPANLADGLDSALNILWNEMKYKIKLTKRYEQLPLTRCNSGQLSQVFVNVLSNAVQAIEADGEIDVEAVLEGSDIVISISDTGCGMSPAEITRIFEPFYTTKETGKGTGLGLSISYEIVKRHGGEIHVESIVGKGSTFRIRIPVVRE